MGKGKDDVFDTWGWNLWTSTWKQRTLTLWQTRQKNKFEIDRL